jgi:hypothetical protein
MEKESNEKISTGGARGTVGGAGVAEGAVSAEAASSMQRPKFFQ